MENTVELVNKAKKGDRDAFESLIYNERELLYRTAYFYARNKEDALDILQESIYSAFISIKSINRPEFFRAWIMKIVVRTAYSFLNAKGNFISIDEVENQIADPLDIETFSGDKILLKEAILSLNLQYQTVIILYYYNELKISEIALVIGKNENTVKTYLRRAKIELRNILEEERYEKFI